MKDTNRFIFYYRTFDIQCKTQQDFDRLLTALRGVCPPALS